MRGMCVSVISGGRLMRMNFRCYEKFFELPPVCEKFKNTCSRLPLPNLCPPGPSYVYLKNERTFLQR